MITLKQLHYALAVEQTLHFKQAAQLCHVSQSTLSTAITELEKHLGVILFERNNKTVIVTDLGRSLLIKARQVKLDVDYMYQLAQVAKAPLTMGMRLGVIPTISPYLLPIVLPEVRRLYPQFQLHITEAQSHLVLEKIRIGELDCGIIALPYPVDGLLTFEFWQEDFYWLSHQDNCPAHLEQISGEQMAQVTLMLLEEGHCLTDHALAVCALSDQVRELTATSLHTLVQMVACKMGSTLIPQMAVQQLIEQLPELRVVPLSDPGPHRRIAFVIRPNYIGTKDIEILINLFNQQLQIFVGKA